MKGYILFAFAIIILLPSYSQQKLSKLDKAKQLIRNEFKEIMNDYASYSPVSFSEIDSLLTTVSDDEFIVEQYQRTAKAKEEAGLDNLELTDDISLTLIEMEKHPENYKDGVITKWKIYNLNRQLLLKYFNEFVPVFIGWKVVHKYRTKNTYNATILKAQEFRFNKDMTELIDIKDMDE